MKAPFNIAVALALLAYAAMTAVHGPAHAQVTITGTTGNVSEIAPPNVAVIGNADGDLDEDEQTSNGNAFIWLEAAIGSTGSAQTVTHVNTGTVSASSQYSGGTMQANQDSASYYFLYDRVSGTSSESITITFNVEIFGVIATDTDLVNSDAEWENPTFGTWTGPTTNGRQFDVDGTGYDFTISNDRHTLTINIGAAGGDTEHLRILLNPEPSTLALFALGGVGMVGMVRRRKRRRRAANSDAA